MAGMKVLVAVLLLVVYVSLVGAQSHHVVGGDRGWAKASEVTEWLSDKVFRVGDKICEYCDCFLFLCADLIVLQLRSKASGSLIGWREKGKGKRGLGSTGKGKGPRLAFLFPCFRVISGVSISHRLKPKGLFVYQKTVFRSEKPKKKNTENTFTG